MDGRPSVTRQEAARYVCWALFGLAIAHALYYHGQLPDTVASHFGANGEADGWSSKTTFTALYIVTVVAMALCFVGPIWLIPRIPDSMINMPRKDYWLAPERRQATFEVINECLLWFASATMLFLLDMFHQTIQANLGGTSTLSHVWWSLGIFLVFTTAWCVLFYRHFLRVPKDSAITQ